NFHVTGVQTCALPICVGASSDTTSTSAACATERTNVALPTPSGPDNSTPSLGDVPSLASSSGCRKARSNHSVNRRATDSAPTRSETGGGSSQVSSDPTTAFDPPGSATPRSGCRRGSSCGTGAGSGASPRHDTTVD